MSLCLQHTAGGKLGVQAPFTIELLQICDSIWGIGKQVLHLRGEDATAAALTCCREMDYPELRVCTEICLCQLQFGTKTLEQSMETTSLLLYIKTCCKGSYGCFFLLIPVKKKLRPKLSLCNLANSPATVSDGVFRNHLELGEICQNLYLHSLWSVPSN